jgi:hypothetical protein
MVVNKTMKEGANMPTELIKYLYADLRDHVKKLEEESYKEAPDGENIEYHSSKAMEIIDMLEGADKKVLELQKAM